MHIQKKCFQQTLVLTLFPFLITVAGGKADCVLEGIVELVEMKSLLSSTFRLNLGREINAIVWVHSEGRLMSTCLLLTFM